MPISARAAAVGGLIAPVSAQLVAVDGFAVTVSYTVFVRTDVFGVVVLDAVAARWVRTDAPSGRVVAVAADASRAAMTDVAVARGISSDMQSSRAVSKDEHSARAMATDTDPSVRTIEGMPMEIYRGDSAPNFGATILDAGVAVDLTGASAVLRMALGGTTVEKTLTIDAPATDGHVSYDWSAAETAAMTAGVYACCIVVTFADSTVTTWPSNEQSPVSIEILSRPA